MNKYFFSHRVVNRWNGLPAKVVNSKFVNAFKNAYDRLCCIDMDVQLADQLASPSTYKYKYNSTQLHPRVVKQGERSSEA